MSFVKEILFQKLALTYIDSIWNVTADRVPLLVILSGSNCSRIIIRAILKIMMVAVDYEINVCIRILAWRNMRHSSNKHLEKKLGQMINYLLCQIFHLGYSWGIFWLVSWSTANHRFTAGNLEYIYNSILGYEGNYILRLKRKPVRVYDKTVSCSNLWFTSALGSICSLTNVKRNKRHFYWRWKQFFKCPAVWLPFALQTGHAFTREIYMAYKSTFIFIQNHTSFYQENIFQPFKN